MKRRVFPILAGLVLATLGASRSDAQVTLTRVTLTDQGTGELLFRGTQTFTPQAASIAIPVNGATTVEGVQVRLMAASQPIDAANPALRTVNDGGRVSTSMVIGPAVPDANTPLSVEVVIPLPTKEAGSFTTRFLLDVGDKAGLRREFAIFNRTGLPWVNGATKAFHLRLKNADGRVLFDDTDFPQLNASRIRWQDIDAKIDSTTMFVRLDQLFDADGTASPANRAGLPRYVRLDNGSLGIGVRSLLPKSTSLTVQGPIAAPVVIDLADGVNLSKDVPVGSAPGTLVPCPDCCCESPVERAKNREFLQVGTDPDVKIASVIRTVRNGLPLAQRDGHFLYLPAEEWKLCVTNDGTTARKLQLFDGRKEVVVLTEGTTGGEITIPPQGAVRDVTVWLFSTVAVLSTKPEDEAQIPAHEKLKGELLAVLGSAQSLGNDAEFRALYCLHPDSRGPATTNFPEHLKALRMALQPTQATTFYLENLGALQRMIAAKRGVDAQRQVLSEIPVPHDPGPRLLQLSLKSESIERSIVKTRAALLLATADLIQESSPPLPIAANP